MYVAPSSDHSLLTLNLPFKVNLRRFEVVRLFSDVWSENVALFVHVDFCNFKRMGFSLIEFPHG